MWLGSRALRRRRCRPGGRRCSAGSRPRRGGASPDRAQLHALTEGLTTLQVSLTGEVADALGKRETKAHLVVPAPTSRTTTDSWITIPELLALVPPEQAKAGAPLALTGRVR